MATLLPPNLRRLAAATFAVVFAGVLSAAENPSFQAEDSVVVDVLARDYGERHFDITFHVPGMDMRLFREYSQTNGWEFERILPHLEFETDPANPSLVTLIIRDGQQFVPVGGGWEYGFARIEVDGSGYRYTDAQSGKWEVYNGLGLIQSFGRGPNTLGTVTNNAAGWIETIEDTNNVVVAEFTYDAPGRISRAENHGGGVVEYTWVGANLTEFIDLRGNTTTYTYTNDRITRKDLPGGIVREMTYNTTYGDLESITDDSGWGRFYEFAFDTTFNEYFIKITYSNGKVEERFYNSDRELVRVKVDGTVVKEVDYLDEGNRIFITDGLGNVTEELITVNGETKQTFLPDGTELRTVLQFDDRDGNFRTIREVDGRGFTTRYQYDTQGRITAEIQADGTPFERRTNYTYAGDNLATITLVGDANMQSSTTTNTYDVYGRLKTIEDGEGHETEFVYDSFNRVVEQIDPLGNSTLTTYNNATGDVLTVTTPEGLVATYTYDALGRIASIENDVGDAISYTHEKFRYIIEDPEGNQAQVIYNRDGQPIEQIDPAGITTERQYDSQGRFKRVIDGNGNVTENVYHASMAEYSDGGFNVLEKIIYPTFERSFAFDSRFNLTCDTYDLGGGVTRKIEALAFDGSDNPGAYRDAEGNVVSYAYDPFGNIIRRTIEVNGQTKITEVTYDDRGAPVEVRLPDNRTYTYAYDRVGNQIEKGMPDGTTYTYSYDGNGRMTERLDPNGGKIVFTYDLDGRPATQQYFYDKNDATPDLTYTFNFNDANQLDSLTDGTLTLSFVRDKIGRILTETVDVGNGIVMSHSKTYYPNGQVKTYTGPDSITYTYTYDAAGLLKTISAPGMGVISWSDYEWRMPTEVVYPGGLTRAMTYDGLQEVASIAMEDSSGSVLFSEDYTRNGLSKVTGVDTGAGIVSYSYDEETQVTGTTSTDPSVPAESFTFDLNFNRTGDLAGNSYSHNLLNSLTGFNADTFTYDANGNLTGRTVGGDTYVYSYTPDDRLARIDRNGILYASYSYDPLGRRISKTTSAGTVYYHYTSAEGLVAEFDASGNVTRTYGYEVVGYQDEQSNTKGLRPLFQKEGGNYYYAVIDHNFRARQLVESDGDVVWSAAVTAFGKALVDPASSVSCNLRLSQQYFDEETGWHYNTKRYYDPDLGRYLRPDPLSIEASDNIYAFVENGATYFVDPLGLACEGCINISISDVGEKKLTKKPIMGVEIKLKYKANIKGQFCRKCCDDGTCGFKGSVGGSFSGELEASYKSGNLSIFGVSIGAGLKVAVSGGFDVGGSAKADCDSNCAEFKGQVFGKLTVGGYVEFTVWGYGAEAFAGGAGKICADAVLKICAPSGSPSFSISGVKFGGEIYLSVKIKFNVAKEFKLTLWKGGGC